MKQKYLMSWDDDDDERDAPQWRVLDFLDGHLPEGKDLTDVKGILASAEMLRQRSFTCERMFKNIRKQRRYTLHYPGIVGLLPILQILVSLRKKDYFHKSSNLTTRPFPF